MVNIAGVSECPKALVAVFSNTCPACHDDARDLIGSAATPLWSNGLRLYVVLEGDVEPKGVLAELALYPGVAVSADPTNTIRAQWQLPGVPCYFLCEEGVVKWCQVGRVMGEDGTNRLLTHLAEEWAASGDAH